MMKNYARINKDNVAIETFQETQSISLLDVFPPGFAAEFKEVPINVKSGWKCNSGAWSEKMPEVPLLSYPTIGAITFQLLFNADEAVKVAELRSSDLKLQSFWKLIDDQRTTEIDLNLSSVQSAIEYTLTAVKAAGIDVDVQKRKEEIMTGVPQ